MVFQRKTSFCELEIIRTTDHKPDILRVKKESLKDPTAWNTEWGTKRSFGLMDDLLKGLRENKDGSKKKHPIQYKIIESICDSEHIFVIISCEESVIEQWATERNVDVPIDAHLSIVAAKEYLPSFLLAKRTYLAEQHEEIELLNDYKYEYEDEYEIDDFVQPAHWENIHIGYEQILHRTPGINLYAKPYNTRTLHPIPSAISHILYLRILYEILTDDAELGGADFLIEAMINNDDEYHPLSQFFALHQFQWLDEVEAAFESFKYVHCGWKEGGKNLAFLDGVRNYYGEQIAFYFAFLTHYTLNLYPLAIVGAVYWIITMAQDNICSESDVFLTLAIIIWSTLLIENWYKREWKLRYRWGMMRYHQTEVPRSAFHGHYVISTVNGLRIETHDNKCLYWFKRIVSICISFICILLVVCVTVLIWGFQSSTEQDYGTSAHTTLGKYVPIAIGMLNSIQILVFNVLFTKLAVTYLICHLENSKTQIFERCF